METITGKKLAAARGTKGFKVIEDNGCKWWEDQATGELVGSNGPEGVTEPIGTFLHNTGIIIKN